MLPRKMMPALLVCLIVCFASTAMAASILTTIGQHPFCKPPLNSVEELRQLAAKAKGDLRQGFAKAGQADLYQDFETQVQTAEVDEVSVQPGERLLWMLFRKRGIGPVFVAKDVTWKGDSAFQAYRLFVVKAGKRYEFVVPQTCGNFSLRSISDLPPAPVKVSQAAKNLAPACGLTLSGQKVRCGEKVIADASGSLDSDGEVVSVTFRLVDPSGVVVWEKTDSEKPFRQEIVVPCAAVSYRVEIVVLDDKGEKSVKDVSCAQQVTSLKRSGGPVVDLGIARLFDPANFILARVGYELPVAKDIYLLGMIGGFLKVDGSDGDSAGVIDLTANWRWLGPASLGLGLGYWAGEDSKLDIIANIGFMVFGDPRKFNGSLFFEMRAATNELDELDSQGRYAIGLRFRF